MRKTKEATMRHVTYSDLRQNLATVMDEVNDSHAPLLVTRQNARPVVMLSQDEYESMEETLHLMSSARNAARLNDAIAEIEAGNVVEIDWDNEDESEDDLT
jgi:antitoxin YefM